MLNTDFKEFAALLSANHVAYLIVGGYALAAHGHPRYTGALDFWLKRTPENAARVLTALSEFGFGSLNFTASDLLKPDGVIQLGHPPRRIDLLNQIDGVGFEACHANRLDVSLGNLVLPLIGKADLIANKQAVGRLHDLADVQRLTTGR